VNDAGAAAWGECVREAGRGARSMGDVTFSRPNSRGLRGEG